MSDYDPRATEALYVAEAKRRKGEIVEVAPAGRGRKAHREAIEKMHKVNPKRQKGRIPLKRRRGVSIPLKKGSESNDVGSGKAFDGAPLSLIISLSSELI